MRWPGPCMGPPEPGARPSLCGILGSLHSGKDPPGLHATSLAGMQARSSCQAAPPASQALPTSLSAPWTPVSLWCPSADPMLILLHPEDSGLALSICSF